MDLEPGKSSGSRFRDPRRKRASTITMKATKVPSILDGPLRNPNPMKTAKAKEEPVAARRSIGDLLPLKRTMSYEGDGNQSQSMKGSMSQFEIAKEIVESMKSSDSMGDLETQVRTQEISRNSSRIKQLESLVLNLQAENERQRKLCNDLRKKLVEKDEIVEPIDTRLSLTVCKKEDFFEPDSDKNIIYGPTNSVEQATLPKLIERITDIKSSPKDASIFLLTNPSFTTPECLLKSLICRYEADIPPQFSPSRAVQFLSTEQQQIRLRVLNTLKLWVSGHFARDFNDELSNDLMSFLHLKVHETNRLFANKLIELIQHSGKTARGNRKDHMTHLQKLTRTMNEVTNNIRAWKHEILKVGECPPPILPKNHRINISFFEWSPLEVARQLCIIEFDVYLCLSPDEFINKAWTRSDKGVKSPNVSNLAARFNDTVNWIGTMILAQNSLAARRKAIERYIEILEQCQKLNNYNAVMEIIGGLQSIAVNRLKVTWEGINKKLKDTYKKICKIVSPDNNHKKLRELLPGLPPPKMPYLGLFLTDIVMWEDGAEDVIDGKINFRKRVKLAQIISEIELYQTTPYPFQQVPELHQYLLALQYLDEDRLYDLSLLAEPRKRRQANHT